MTQISLLGCGLMGVPMARRLLAAGLPLTVWNRTRAKAEVLVANGAGVAATPAAAVQGADVVITMLEHGGTVASVLFESGADSAVHGLKPGAVVVDMSSILPEQAREHARQLAAVGCRHIDAPVSGGTVGAEQGTLAIMAGGEAADLATVADVLAHLGRLTHVGPSGSGQLAKLANQMIVGITIGAVAEALLLAEKGGADPAMVRQALRGGFAESRVLEVHGQRMVDGDFAKRGSLAIQLKDMRNALHTANGMGLDIPITHHLGQLYAQAAAQGCSDLDQSGLYVALKQLPPLPGPKPLP
ncbi:MAG: hypothetical protein RI907_1014 [Pseudomonadota bacterium]